MKTFTTLKRSSGLFKIVMRVASDHTKKDNDDDADGNAVQVVGNNLAFLFYLAADLAEAFLHQ